MRWFLSFLLAALVGLAQAVSSSGSRLLVVLEQAADKDLYSTFWADLTSRGYALTFESPKNEKLSLFQHGARSYDHVIVFPPKSKGLGPALAPKKLLDFVNEEGNILFALSGSSATPSAISALLLELDIQLSPDRSSVVVDHFSYDLTSAAEKHDVLLLPRPHAFKAGVKNYFGGDGVVAFPRAAGQILGSESPLLAPIVRAPETAYTYNPKDDAATVEEPFATGQQLALVAAMQARNSARVTVLGSAESLEDQWFSASVKSAADGKQIKTANQDFAKQLTAWTFKEAGVLQVGRIQHYLNEGSADSTALINASESNPTLYRIKNDISFTIELSEYDGDRYVPLEIPEGDELQLEFTMLSPFHRLNLKPISQTANSTIFATSFTLPDQHGIFSFRVNYKRPFLTNVEEKHEVTVRHFAHDEYPRSWAISGGWVWIAGLWSVIGGFLTFAIVWLYSAPTSTAEAKLKKAQ